MADFYLDDGGSATAPYDTLAKAANDWATVVAAMSAGDRLLVVSDTIDVLSATATLAFPGTLSSPNQVISISSVDESYLKASAAQIDASASVYDLSVTGYVTFYGILFKIGDDFRVTVTDCVVNLEDCAIELTGGSSVVECGSPSGGNKLTLKETDVNFSNGGDGFETNSQQEFEWDGGTLSFTGTQPTYLFRDASQRGSMLVKNVDLSSITTTIFQMNQSAIIIAKMINCILNSSVTIATSIDYEGSSVTMLESDDTTGNDLYRIYYADYFGSVVHDDAIYRTAGAAYDGTNISWQLVSSANALEYHRPLRVGIPILAKFKTTGSKTFTCHLVFDNATDLQDDEVWIEVEYLGASANIQRSLANDRMADPMATPANQATSTESWTGTGGFTNENKHQLVVTQTVNRVGMYKLWVCLAKPSTTIYACPKIEIS